MKFANLIVDFERESHRQRNVGDDLQLYAIQNLYEYMGVDYSKVVRIKLSDLSSYDGEYLILPINYPFYGYYNQLSPKILPVYLGISVLSAKRLDSLRLKAFEPIGCRDNHTLKEMRKYGISAYLNGCMTLTLPKRSIEPKHGKTFLVDICNELKEYIPPHILHNSEEIRHLYFQEYFEEDYSINLYKRYLAEAGLVITSRLHCAVPCLAAGIPVIFACSAISYRCQWLEKIIKVYSSEEFKNIDWEPKLIEIEDIKKRMLELAKARILKTYKQFHDLAEMNDIFESESNTKYGFESLDNTMRYIAKEWKGVQKEEYLIWGDTQTGELLYDYIKENYPTMICKGVIDLFKDETFLGHSLKLDSLDGFEGTVFVAVESANKMALNVFKEKGICKFFLCWKKEDYQIL